MPGATSSSFQSFDIVVVPFPFTEQPVHKLRPSLILSTPEFTLATGHVMAAKVTTASRRWETDLVIRRLGRLSRAAVTGVRAPSGVEPRQVP